MSAREVAGVPRLNSLKRFAAAINRERGRLLEEWRNQVRRLPAARNMDTATLNNHIPPLLDRLSAALEAGHTESVLDLQLENSPQIHGSQRLHAGFDIIEVVGEYNILREVLHRLAADEKIEMSPDVSRILNRVVDSAIALAVDTYAKQKALEMQQRREEHLSFVMHDLRTPISAMQMAGRILQKSLDHEAKTQRVRNMLDLLRRNADRVNALLRMAAEEQQNVAAGTTEELRVQRRVFDLWPLVEDLVHDLRSLSESRCVQIVNTVPTDFVVFADAVLLNQIFQNLVSNAIKYTSWGQIVIGAESADERKSVRCWVRDTGAGIPPERIGKVFDKFETSSKDTGGQGLGLAIVRQIVEAHGGEVVVESAMGEGSQFTFTLPLNRGPVLFPIMTDPEVPL